MPKFRVDFSVIGDIMVAAKDEDEARRKVGLMGLDELSDHVQDTKVGENYVDRVD